MSLVKVWMRGLVENLETIFFPPAAAEFVSFVYSLFKSYLSALLPLSPYCLYCYFPPLCSLPPVSSSVVGQTPFKTAAKFNGYIH